MSAVAERLVRLAARTLPAAVRDRYREEWLADLAGAADAGVSRTSIAVGALTTAITIDRLDPAVSGLALGVVFRHRLRVAAGLGLAGLVLLAGWYLYGGYSSLGGVVASAGVVVLLGALALAAAGVVALLGAAAVAARSGRAAISVVLVLVPVLAGALVVTRLVGVLLLVAAPVALLLAIVSVALSGSVRRTVPVASRLALVVVFGVAALATCAVGILHVFVWNPLARVPGLTLDEIYARLAAAREGVAAVPWSVAWAAVTVLAVVALIVFAVAPRTARFATTRRLTVLGLFLVSGTTLLGFLPAFGMGMGLADTFATSGGDAAATGPLLAVIGQACLAAALLVAFVRPITPEPVAEVPS